MDVELPHEIRLMKETIRKFVDRELIPIETKARGEDAQRAREVAQRVAVAPQPDERGADV